MLFTKILIQEVKKTFSNVGADLLATQGIKPDYLPVSVILFPMFSSCSTFLYPLSFKAFSNSGLAELKS